MDKIDQQLLILLRRNGREAFSKLAAHLGITRATVRARIEKMQRDGVITAFTIEVDQNHQDSPVQGLMMIKIEGNAKERVKRAALRVPEIARLYSTNGRWDLIAQIAAVDLAHFDRVLDRIRDIDGIQESETNLLLSDQKKT